MRKSLTYYSYSIILIFLFLSSCFTGVEGTKKITEKDVIQSGVIKSDIDNTLYAELTPMHFSNWQIGKTFYVTDDQIKIVLSSVDNMDNVILKGNNLKYEGFTEENHNGIDSYVVINLTDDSGIRYKYNTGKTLFILSDSSYQLKIPFTIDNEMVDEANKLYVGKSFYINSSNWCDSIGNSIDGVKYEKVTIDKFLPGNKIYSFNVCFQFNGKKSYIFVATKDNSIYNKYFNDIFTIEDPHKFYPTITDDNWNLIKIGKIAKGMTKDECRLSLGAPSDVNKIPTYDGLQEHWIYKNGVYLIFFDGLLTNYRI